MSLLISEPPLQVLPSLAVQIGLNEAIVLQQVHYWMLRSNFVHDNKKWVYNTIQQWKEQFPFWSDDTILRTLKKLKSSGLLIGKPLSDNKFDKTMYYTIEYSKIDASIAANCDHPQTQVAGISNTENTTETTKKRGKKSDFDPLSIELPDCIRPSLWESWIEYRKQIGKELSKASCERQIKDLEAWYNKGHDIEAAINTSIRNGWQGLFEPKGSVQPQKPVIDNNEIARIAMRRLGGFGHE